ncbi:MAG: hypothetical protein JW751_11685 [Polyangiaceae bacterium]|nr:hypothetical protein [Polyangiaceae bacterium]
MTPIRRRVASVLLILGLVAVGLSFWAAAPTEYLLVVDLGEPALVRRMAVTYWSVRDPDLKAGFSQAFSVTPPRRVSHAISATHPELMLRIEVERDFAGRRESTTTERRVSLVGREVTVFTGTGRASNANRE